MKVQFLVAMAVAIELWSEEMRRKCNNDKAFSCSVDLKLKGSNGMILNFYSYTWSIETYLLPA